MSILEQYMYTYERKSKSRWGKILWHAFCSKVKKSEIIKTEKGIMKKISFLLICLAFAFQLNAQDGNKKNIHRSQPWMVHGIAQDFELLDVWEYPISADKTKNQDFSYFLEVIQQPTKNSVSSYFSIRYWLARFLMALRLYLGDAFDLDENINSLPIPGSKETSVKDRLSTEDRKRFLTEMSGEGAQNLGIWRIVYLCENEMLAEHSNDTVHVLMHFGWIHKSGDYYTAQLAVYAKPRGELGRLYMQLIMPFRHLVIYPVMMKEVKKRWDNR